MTTTQQLIMERSLFVLNNRIKDPSYLLSLWKLSGSVFGLEVPEIEKVSPSWWEGIFDND